MKKWFLFVLSSLIFIYSGVTSMAFEIVSANTEVLSDKAEIIWYGNCYVSGNSLKSSNIEVLDSKSLSVSYSNTTLFLNGIIKDTSADIKISYSNNEIIDTLDTTNNFKVLSILNMEDYIRIILENCGNNIVYINIPAIETMQNIDNFNQNWYADYVPGKIEEVPTPVTRATTTDYKFTYTNTTEVMGEKTYEKLVLQAIYEWPDTINSSTGGEFRTSLGILESYTQHTDLAGKTRTWRNCSLRVNKMNVHVATAKGEYVSYARTQFVGKEYKEGEVKLGYALAIPKTNFSISYSYPTVRTFENGDLGYFTYPASNENKVVRTKISFGTQYSWIQEESTVHRGQELGEKAYANFKIETLSKYIQTGRKGFKVEWQYSIYSDGNAHGYGTNWYNTSKTFPNTLYYTLKE